MHDVSIAAACFKVERREHRPRCSPPGRSRLLHARLWRREADPSHHGDAERMVRDARRGGALRQGARMNPDLATLIDLNRDYIQSVQEGDVRRFDEILADDFLCSNPDGSLVDRAAFLKQTAQPVKIANLEAHDVNVRLMGDVAIVQDRTSYTLPDGQARSGRYTDVWARRDGRWLAVSAHVTR